MEKSNNLKAHYQSSSIYVAIIEITADETVSSLRLHYAICFSLLLMNVNSIESQDLRREIFHLINFLVQDLISSSTREKVYASQFFFTLLKSTHSSYKQQPLNPLVSSRMIYYGKNVLVSLIMPPYIAQLCCL